MAAQVEAFVPHFSTPVIAHNLRPILQIDEQDLDKPTAGAVQAIYAALLKHFIGVDCPEHLRLPRDATVATIEMPHAAELWRDSLGLIMFFEHCLLMIGATSIRDFTISDLTRPEAARTKKVLSALINLHLHEVEQAPFLQTVVGKSEKSKHKNAQLKADIARAKKQIQAIQEKHEADKPDIAVLKEKTAVMKQQISESMVLHTQMDGEHRQFKAEKENVTQELTKAATILETLQQEVQALKGQIISSPARQQREVADMAQVIEQGKKKESDMDARMRKLREKVATLESLKQEIKASVAVMKEIEVHKKKLNKATAAMTREQGIMQKRALEYEELLSLEQRTITMISNLENKLARTKEASELKSAEIDRKMTMINEKHAEIMSSRAEASKEIELKREQIMKIELDMRALEAQAEQNKSDFHDAWDQMERHLKDYEEAITLYIDTPGPYNSS